MPELPQKYIDLKKLEAPKLVVVALRDYGLKETPGPGDNPTIMQWAKKLGIKDYIHDAIAWCGLTMAHWWHDAEKPVINEPLWALNWAKAGQKADRPSLGDTLVFKRDGGGHVALYVGEDDDCYHILGGNQSDMVNITRRQKSTLVAARRPIWKIAQPEEVRPIKRSATGAVSTNEA